MTDETTARITRRRHRRGDLVTATFGDGRSVTGYIDGWGPQILALRPTDGGLHGWKVESYPTIAIMRVETVDGQEVR